MTPPAGDDEMRRARRRSLSLACCTREAFRDLPASAAAAAASAELSLLPPPSSRPRRSTSEVQRRLAATPVVARRFGSTQGAALLPTCPLRHPAAADDHERALAGAQSATPDAPDSYRCSSTGARSAGRALRADPQPALSPPLTSAFSPESSLHTTLSPRR